MDAKLFAVYAPVNACWFVVFGRPDRPITEASVVRVGLTKSEAKDIVEGR